MQESQSPVQQDPPTASPKKNYILIVTIIIAVIFFIGAIYYQQRQIATLQATIKNQQPTNTPIPSPSIAELSPTIVIEQASQTSPKKVATKLCTFLFYTEYYVENNHASVNVHLLKEVSTTQEGSIALVAFGPSGKKIIANPNFSAGQSVWSGTVTIPQGMTHIDVQDDCKTPTAGGAELIWAVPTKSANDPQTKYYECIAKDVDVQQFCKEKTGYKNEVGSPQEQDYWKCIDETSAEKSKKCSAETGYNP